MKQITTKSGIKGYECHLQDNYSSFAEFGGYDDSYGLAARLGFKNAREAWKANPIIQGSTNPEDYCTIPEKTAPPTPVPTTGGELELKLEYSLNGSIFIMQDEMPIAAIQANDDNGEVILKEDEETAKEIVKRFNAFPSISFDLQCLATDKKELEEQNKVLLEALKDICGYWEDKGEDEYTLALKDNNLYQAAKAAIQSASK